MSEVTRLMIMGLIINPDHSIEVRAVEAEKGDFVFYSDYAKLEAERDELNRILNDTVISTKESE